jgi:hypothetical protein
MLFMLVMKTKFMLDLAMKYLQKLCSIINHINVRIEVLKNKYIPLDESKVNRV